MVKKTKKGREIVKDVGVLTTTSVGLGVGSQIVTRAGGNPAGLQSFGTMLPVIGTTLGAKALINISGDIFEPKLKNGKKKKNGI